MLKRIAALALAVTLYPVAGCKSAPPPPVAELVKGSTAPNFQLQGSDGKMHSLSDHSNKQTVVIAWFPKAFTGGCTIECKSLHENSEKLKAFDIALYAASVDEPGDSKKFSEELGLDYPLLSDPSKATARAFGVLNEERGLAERWTFIIGPNGKVLDVVKDVSPISHGQDLAERLKQLGVTNKAP